MDTYRRNDALFYLSGPVALAVFAATYNAVAHYNGRPTISSGIRWFARQNLGAEVSGAIAGGLLAHWFLRLIEETE